MNIDDKVRFVAPIGVITQISSIQEKVDGSVVTRTQVTVQYETVEGKLSTKTYNSDMLEIVK